VLRESAMCPDADKASFEDVSLHKYFNTNNLWVSLPALKVGGAWWLGLLLSQLCVLLNIRLYLHLYISLNHNNKLRY